MIAHFKKHRLAVTIFAGALLLNSCQSNTDAARPRAPAAASAARPASKHAQLAAAIQDADRVEVSKAGATVNEAPLLVKRGAGVATEFLTDVRIDDLAGDFHCDCGVAQVVRFYRGDSVLAELTVHGNQSIRWEHGPWTGDALVRDEYPAQSYTAWYARNGGDPMQIGSPDFSAEIRKREEGDRLFVECFPAAAQGIARMIGAVTKEGTEPWREESELPKLVPDKLALAAAAFRALGSVYRPWYVDDYRIAAVQTAVADLPPEDFLRALEACAHDDRALRGAARIYLRFALHRRLSAAANTEWLPKLADAMLRTGERFNLPLVLIYVASAKEPAAWKFLREVATGERTYLWPTDCQIHRLAPHEPSLIASAAVLLAVSGDRHAPRLAATSPQPVPGLDVAAEEVAAALLNPACPLRAAHFRYESRILTYAATEAAMRLPSDAIPAGALGAVLNNNDYSFGRQLTAPLYAKAEALGLQRCRRPTEVNLFSAPVEQSLATENPPLAVQQCTEKLPAAKGVDRTALLLIRAIAHENQHHFAEAIADFSAALKAGGYSADTIHWRLAFLLFAQSRLIEAQQHLELGLREKPTADMFTLRGIIKYALNNFGPEADLDFTAAIALQPNQGYAEIFQHLCAGLSRRPQLSRLSGEVRYETTPPNTITVGPGNSLNLDFSGGAMPPWPAAIISFLKGDLTASALLERAKLAGAEEQAIQTCEAHFYISQKARVAGNTAEEREHLTQCLAVEIPQLAEYRLAIMRLDTLK